MNREILFTDNTKELFIKWIRKRFQIQDYELYFERLDFLLQIGVYIEYLDSIGYYIDIQPCNCCFHREWFINITGEIEDSKDCKDCNDWILGYGEYKNRISAFIDGIEKVNKLINNNYANKSDIH